MSKKKILYIHGFCSSAQTGTVNRLREVLSDCDVHAIDVNHHPKESIKLIEDYVMEHDIDLLMGTSLGGYYVLAADVVCPKVAINPATNPEVMLNHPEMFGHLRYFNPRQDGNWYFDFGPENLQEFHGIPFRTAYHVFRQNRFPIDRRFNILTAREEKTVAYMKDLA